MLAGRAAFRALVRGLVGELGTLHTGMRFGGGYISLSRWNHIYPVGGFSGLMRSHQSGGNTV